LIGEVLLLLVRSTLPAVGTLAISLPRLVARTLAGDMALLATLETISLERSWRRCVRRSLRAVSVTFACGFAAAAAATFANFATFTTFALRAIGLRELVWCFRSRAARST
jgi:hypothetical protein